MLGGKYWKELYGGNMPADEVDDVKLYCLVAFVSSEEWIST